MAFLVNKVFHNTYRCGCCRHETEADPVWYDNLPDALAELPLEIPEESDFGGVYSVTVIDGTTGEKVAWGQLHWSTGFGKYSGYQYTCWAGFHPDKGAFEVIHSRDGVDITGKTWMNIMLGMKEAYQKKQVADAEKALAKAQQDLDALKG